MAKRLSRGINKPLFQMSFIMNILGSLGQVAFPYPQASQYNMSFLEYWFPGLLEELQQKMIHW